jgi:ribosomal protein S18 acetylase RimI-like enzyme
VTTGVRLDPEELSRREMRRMAQVRAAISDEHERFGGLVAAWSGKGCWNSEADGWSPDVRTTRADLEGVVGFYAARDADARVAIAPHIDGHLLAELASLGFEMSGVDLQYVIDLRSATLEPAAYPGDVRTEVLDPAADGHARLWSELGARVHAGRDPSEDERRTDRRVIAHPNTRCLFVRAGDDAVGLGGVEVYDGLACLFFGGVVESHRRRGIQLALIRERLAIAREMGAHHAIIGSLPGSPTERNALRAGMRLVFPKLEFVRSRG